MPYAASLSAHPLAAHAVGEVVGDVFERLGPRPDLAVLFVTDSHVGVIDQVVAAVHELLAPVALIGATAESVLAGRTEVEHQPALALWAGRLPAPVEPVHLAIMAGSEGAAVHGVDDEQLARADALVLLADPFTFPVDALLAELSRRHPLLKVIGGLASGGRQPGTNRLVVDRQVHRNGAAGVLLGAGAPMRTVVSQGCRPIGQPYIVTAAERQLLRELAGRPAIDRLREVIGGLPADDRVLAQQGIHLGMVVDESRIEFDRGDFLIRGVLGVESSTGALAVGDTPQVGTTVQFQVRDATSADEDLRALLSDASAGAAGALVFTCNGRGTNLFAEPDHDAIAVSDFVPPGAVAGMFCAGEVGPVGARSYLHGFTASVALFRD